MKGTTFADGANVLGAFPMGPTTSNYRRSGTSLESLRTVLKALDRTGDFSLPSIVELRRILAERVFAMERLEEIRSSVSSSSHRNRL